MSQDFCHPWDSEVFIIQAKSRQGLLSSAQRIMQIISSKPDIEIKDLAFTLNCPMQKGGTRLAIVADSLDDLRNKLEHGIRRLEKQDCMKIKDRGGIYFFSDPLSSEGNIAFLFPGEGSQYSNMLYDLCIHFQEIRYCFDIADRVFMKEGRELLPSQLLFPPPGSQNNLDHEKLWEINIAVASVLTADYALMRLMDSLEIRPQAIVGHSSGEFAALIAAGAMKIDDEDDRIQIGRDLIKLYTSLDKPVLSAKLMTVGLADPEIVTSLVKEHSGDLYVAMDNCPHQVILCGIDPVISRAYNRLREEGAICGLLPYDRPYHTPLYQEVSDHFLQFFNNQKIVSPSIDLYSCATTRRYPTTPSEIRQLAVDQWSRPVRFRETIETMYAAGARIFVEVGPRGNLSGFVEDILEKRRHIAIPSNVPNRSAITQINHMIGLLAAHGVTMRLNYLYARRFPERLPLDEILPFTDRVAKPSLSIKLSLEAPKLKLNPDTRVILSSVPLPPRTISDNSALPIVEPAYEDQKMGHHFQTGRLKPHSEGLRAKAMHEYLRTMDRFLQVQEDVIFATLQKRALKTEEYSHDNPKISKNGSQGPPPNDRETKTCLPDLKSKFLRFSQDPRSTILSTSWSSPIAHFPASSGFRCCIINKDATFIHQHEIAQLLLSPQELEIWSHLPEFKKRHGEWLLGRFVAKDAVRLFLADRYQLRPHPAEIEIASDERGRPFVKGALFENLNCHVSLSISHSMGEAAAIAGNCREDQAVGIDIEHRNRLPKKPEEMRVFLSSTELDLIAEIPEIDREEWGLRLWCAKEALGKAIGTGLLGNPRQFIAKDYELKTGKVSMLVSGNLTQMLSYLKDKLIFVSTGYERHLVFASLLL